jgi:hypothetical protein
MSTITTFVVEMRGINHSSPHRREKEKLGKTTHQILTEIFTFG